MVDWRDWPAARAAVMDVGTSAEHLAEIAAVQSGLWSAIAAHPNVYPALLDWLDSQGRPEVSEAVRVRRFADAAAMTPSTGTGSPELEDLSIPLRAVQSDSSSTTVARTTTVQGAPEDLYRTTNTHTPLSSAESALNDDLPDTSFGTSYTYENPNEPNPRRVLIIGLIVGLAVLLLVGGGLGYYFVHQRPLSSAQQTYDTSVRGLKNAQAILSQSIELANRVVATDSALIPQDAREALTSSVLATRPLLEGPSGEPTGAQQLLDAAVDLDSRAKQVRDTDSELQTMIDNLVDRVSLALEGIVSAGREVYDASAGLVGEDDETRPRLSDALKPTCTQSDSANKITCSDKVASDIVAQARGVLAPVVQEAQKEYNSSEGQLADDAPRVALHDAIGKATCDQGGPAEVMACIKAAFEAVPAAQNSLNNSLHNQTYKYVITGPDCGQIGWNCGYPLNGIVESIEGWSAFSQAAFLWMKVSVTGDEVAVSVCGTQGGLQDVKNCSFQIGVDESWAWSGRRKGSEAVITPKDDIGPGSAFTWATLTFAGPESASPVIGVVFPQVCEKIDGSYGTGVTDNGPFHCE